MDAGLPMICVFFIVGGLLEKAVHTPGPILMILTAILCRYTNIIPTTMELGAHNCYKFVPTALVQPLMIGLGMLHASLESAVSAFSAGYVVVCDSTVIVTALSGFLIAACLNMYPVEAAIVTSRHSGLEGAGDAVILSVSDRMGLIPFAQTAMRIGGVPVVIAATLLSNWAI